MKRRILRDTGGVPISEKYYFLRIKRMLAPSVRRGADYRLSYSTEKCSDGILLHH